MLHHVLRALYCNATEQTKYLCTSPLAEWLNVNEAEAEHVALMGCSAEAGSADPH